MESVVNLSLASYYRGKKIFVTGHTGFKGAWLITWLHLLGANITGYALNEEDSTSLFSVVKDKIIFNHIKGDIRNSKKLKREIQNFQPDIIFHLAAQAIVRRSYQIPSETFEVNAIGTANVLEAANELSGKCTIVVITTDKVYENIEKNYFYKEDDVLGGYDPYSASKAAAELVVNSFRRSFFDPAKFSVHGKAVATARAGNVIGGGDWNTDRIIPDIVRSMTANNPVLVRNPHSIRPWQLVLEPLYGYLILAMLLNENVDNFSGAYNFGPLPDDHLPVKDLVDIALDCWGSGGKWIDMSHEPQPHEAGLLQLDISKAKEFLKWQPKLRSREAIEWTINWYKQPQATIFEYTVGQILNYQQQ